MGEIDQENYRPVEVPGKLSDLTNRVVECVGPFFLTFWNQSEGDSFNDADEEESDDESIPATFDEEDIFYIRNLDPKNWKQQDHYAVLGLSKLRYFATKEDIKRAYRLKVLRHHPDKKSSGVKVPAEEDYFTCITRAWEVLGNPIRRRAYDSVDPLFDDDVPPSNEFSKKNFYEVFGPVFERNSRWSRKTPVPKLGDSSSKRAEVERFYSFWYNFDSWREYSYLDEEEKEQGQDRDERRWIEKQNKSARLKRKKEEMTRIRNLVDIAYRLDPRIEKFKQEEADRKLQAKQAKKEAARAIREEMEKRRLAEEEEVRRIKEEQEAAEKAKQDAIKAQREIEKKALKKERKALRKLVKENNYYVSTDDELVRHMSTLEHLCETLSSNELAAVVKSVTEKGRDGYLEAMTEFEINQKKRNEDTTTNFRRQNDNSDSGKSLESKVWNKEHIQTLIKAVKMFPAGTSQRWEVIANFLNDHCDVKRTSRDVLSKVKDLKNSGFSKDVLVSDASNDPSSSSSVSEYTSSSSDTLVNRNNSPSTVAKKDDDNPWTPKEQLLLEQALKTYPPTVLDRWDKISECVPSRTKKECMKRYKELAELIKAKRAAQNAN